MKFRVETPSLNTVFPPFFFFLFSKCVHHLIQGILPISRATINKKGRSRVEPGVVYVTYHESHSLLQDKRLKECYINVFKMSLLRRKEVCFHFSIHRRINLGATCSSVVSRFNNRNEYPECLVTATLPFIGGKKRGATTQGGGQEWKESYIRAFKIVKIIFTFAKLRI